MGVTSVGYTYGTVDQIAKTQVMTLNCSITAWGGYDDYEGGARKALYGAGSWGLNYPYNGNTGKSPENYFYRPSNQAYSILCNGANAGGVLYPDKCECDRTYKFEAVGKRDVDGNLTIGSQVNFKAYAIDAIIATPSFGTPTSSSCAISCDYTPNTYESTADVTIQYKKTSDPSWANSTITVSGTSGYTGSNLSGTLTGLDGNTTYQVRAYMLRTTVNSTTAYGATASFTTAASTPTITTNAATSVASLSATLNGTVNPNGLNTSYYFEWGTTTGYGNTTASQGPGSGTSNVDFSQIVTGLSYSTLYHFRAVALVGATPYYGSDASFTTLGDPGVQAADQSHVVLLDYDAIYGQAATFYFVLMPPKSAGNFDSFVNSNVLASGDVTAIDSAGNSLGAVTAGYISGVLFYCTPTASQLSHDLICVNIKDQDVTPQFRDAQLVIRTKDILGKALIDPTNKGGNAIGVSMFGAGSSPAAKLDGGATSTSDMSAKIHWNGGMLADGGGRVSYTTATTNLIYLESGSSVIDGFYNGLIVVLVAGTGAGQARVISDYDYSTGGTPNPSFKATVQPAWTTLPSATDTDYILLPGSDVWSIPLAELSSLPDSSSSVGEKLQLLFQRFAFKIVMNATVQTWYKSDNTVLFTRVVEDTTALQSLGKLGE
jgi:hypothetical protein